LPGEKFAEVDFDTPPTKLTRTSIFSNKPGRTQDWKYSLKFEVGKNDKFACKLQIGVDGEAGLRHLLRLAIFVCEVLRIVGRVGEIAAADLCMRVSQFLRIKTRHTRVAAGSGVLGDHL
jgi:hypothetical protein